MTTIHRIAINAGGGYVPGLDLVASAATRAASRLGIEVVAIRNGYDGLLDAEADRGVLPLDPHVVATRTGLLGTGARIDPFRARRVSDDGMVEEVDRSADVLGGLARHGIDGVISIVGGSAVTGLHALTVAWKLAKAGLATVCVPKSVEADIPGVSLPFGYDTALNETTRLLTRIRAGAADSGRIAVVEVPGRHAGWLALQAGLAAGADAVLIPDIPMDLGVVAEAASHGTLIVVAQGTAFPAHAVAEDATRASLSPNADPAYGTGSAVIDTAGTAARRVAEAIQRVTSRDVLPFAIGPLIRGGEPTALDRQLAAAYGAAAVEALHAGATPALLSFEPPAMRALPIPEVLSGVRNVPPDGALLRTARALGLCLGDAP
jgi:6-phosphofructokinase 1